MKKICILMLLIALLLTGCDKYDPKVLILPWSTEIDEDVEPTTSVTIELEYVTEETGEDETVEEPTVVDPEETTDQKVSLGTYILTAYCSCEQCCGWYALNRPLDDNGEPIVYTASGNRAVAGVTIAVDPYVIPYGSKVEINGHVYTAHDTGGLIKGNRIDVYFANHEEACAFGRQEAEVFLVKG